MKIIPMFKKVLNIDQFGDVEYSKKAHPQIILFSQKSIEITEN